MQFRNNKTSLSLLFMRKYFHYSEVHEYEASEIDYINKTLENACR